MAFLRGVLRFHRLVGLVIGIQLLFWTASGFFFTLFPIEVVRGEHLIKQPAGSAFTAEDGIAAPSTLVPIGLQSAELKRLLGRPVYEVRVNGAWRLIDARDGAQLSPIPEETARKIAEATFIGQGELAEMVLLPKAPREVGGGGSIWQAQFIGKDTATLYIRPSTGEARVVRTGLWRWFDALWGLHIMDWWERESFTSWWMKLFSGGALIFVLSGLVLIIHRTFMGRLFR